MAQRLAPKPSPQDTRPTSAAPARRPAHPAIVQLCHLIAAGRGPFRSQCPPGYRRGIDFYSAAQLPQVVRDAADKFHSVHGRYPDLLNPELFSDKIFASKFLRPFKVPEAGNKLLTGRFIPDSVRDQVLTPEVVWHSRTARIPRGDEIAPGTYYLKTNHGCDMFRRVEYPLSEDAARALDSQFEAFLSGHFGLRMGNWWHNAFPPEVMLEKAVGSLEFTTSFNYYVIGGEVALLVPYQKLTNAYRKSYFAPDWTPLPESTPAHAEFVMPSDSTKERMHRLAEAIGGPLGFARIDFLLDDDEQPYLGEVTFTPGNGLSRVSEELDRKLGQMWSWPQR